MSARVLLLPGWLDSGAGHWQSRWEARYGDIRVVQHDWVAPRRGDWVARLEEVVIADRRPVLLVAHSLGCVLVAAWAGISRNASRAIGALLVAPPDVEHEAAPREVAAFAPVPDAPLPFPATVVVSDDDPFCAPGRSAQFATAWRAARVSIGPRGHINAESGLGDWAEGRALLDDLARKNSHGNQEE